MFILLWVGQLVSLTGSGLTGFALGIWTYQRTGSATQYALIFAFSTLPAIVISPFAGSLVDRWDRRRVLIASHVGVGGSTLLLALLLVAGRLEVWHIYLASAFQAALNTFQWLALSAAVTLIVPQRQLGRASGMTQLAEAVARIVAPALAGALLLGVRLWGVLLLNCLASLIAVLTLLVARIPGLAAPQQSEQGRGGFWRDLGYGWSYVTARRGLLGLLLFFALTNFLSGTVVVLGTPFVLSFASAAALGVILSAAGVGMLAGNLVVSAWGGPRRRVYGVLGFEMLAGACIVMAGFGSSAMVVGVATFVFSFSVAVTLAASQAIWQSKVEPGVQGRVFAVRRMIAWSTLPFAYVIAGPLADKVFVPLLVSGGPLAATVGRVLGVGPGRGIGLLFIVLGTFVVLISALGFLSPRLRGVEDELPDGGAPIL
ncbi:MAG: MFS transporter [Acidobacteriota bacterium]|nr:MFS transporter [Acidobacteriota bacterium]